MNTINVENCKTLLIGRRGENEVATVAFDFTEWASEFGSGVVDLYVKRFGDNSAYPVVLTIDGTVASWLVTETDTNVAGYGKAEYVYRVDGKIAKSAVFPFFVAEDIGQPASEPPDPYESWLEQLTALGAETEAHAQAAEQSAEDAAESAEDAAQSATSAESYAGQAETAAGLAQAAQTASEAARDAAQTAQASAEASATAASGSAASAAGSATAAAGFASDASASASAAGASATAASASATTASNAATAAQTAQSAAEDAAEDAQQAAQEAHVEYEQLSGEVDDLSDEVSQQKSAIDDLSALVDRKAGMLVDTASGSIASFTPDATIPDLLGVTVDIEPVQDLHGYDNPWPAGGGKNKFNVNAVETVTDTFGGKITQNQNGTITIQTSASANVRSGNTLSQLANVSVGERYTLTLTTTGSQNLIYLAGIGVTWYDGESKTITQEMMDANVCFYASGPNTSATVSNIMIRLASDTDATFAPYSNICPISGRDSVKVEATGINIWDEEWEVGGIGVDGAPIVQTDRIRSKNYCPCVGDTKYYFHIPNKNLRVFFYDADKTYLTFYGYWDYAMAFTSPTNARYFKILGSAAYGTTYNNDISINYPSTDHAYHPYAGNRYTIQLGQTVYGGTLDVTNGTLTVDRAMVDLGTLTWYYSTQGTPKFYLSANLPNQTTVAADLIFSCSAYKNGVQAGITSANLADYSVFADWNKRNGILVTDSRYTDVTSFRNAVSGVQLVYRLATPIEIQLDPVTISTISGQTNNAWADAGAVSVEFAADVKTYIDNKIAAAVAALS